MTNTGGLREDDRGVSIAITHVMTIAITAMLISGLMFGAGSMLEGEKDRSAGQSLETIGERLSGEIASVDRLVENGTGNATVTVDHPRRVSGSQYTIELEDACSTPLIDDDQSCLRLTSHGGDVEVGVPVETKNANVTDSEATGGTIVIEYDPADERISIERDSR